MGEDFEWRIGVEEGLPFFLPPESRPRKRALVAARQLPWKEIITSKSFHSMGDFTVYCMVKILTNPSLPSGTS
jgi:hypothetical protein